MVPAQSRLYLVNDAHTYGLKVIQFAAALVCLLVLDAAWLTVSKRLYASTYNPNEVKIWYGAIAWISLAVGIGCIDAEKGSSSTIESLAWGGLVGLVGYGTFNGTEAAIRPQWRKPGVILADMAWGIAACAGSCIASQQFARLLM